MPAFLLAATTRVLRFDCAPAGRIGVGVANSIIEQRLVISVDAAKLLLQPSSSLFAETTHLGLEAST
jgi:hypothetical protein